MNSSPASSQISRSSSPASARMLSPACSSRAVSSFMPAFSRLAQDVHERQLDVVQEVLQPALAQLLALAPGELVDQHGVDRLRVVGLDRHAALLAQLGERVAAARRVEQVGGDLGVEDEVRRDLAERLGVVGDHRPVAGGGDELGGVGDLAGERVRPARVGAEAPAALARQQLALGRPRAPWRRARARRRSAWRRRAAAPLRTATVRAVSASGRGIAADSAASSASSSRRSGSRSSNSRNIARSRRAVGLARRARPARSSSTGTSRTIVASCLETRASSANSVRFCLRLAPEIWSTLASTSSSEPKRCSSSAAVLSPIPGTPGMLSRRVALEPDEVGHELGRDPVAVDHALAVVDLRVGDPARGRHDPHAVGRRAGRRRGRR